MYYNASELVKNTVDKDMLLKLMTIIQLGEVVYRDLIRYQKDIFKSECMITEKPRLRNKIIHSQFDEKLISKDFPFECENIKVSNFPTYVPILSNEKIKLSIHYSYSNNALPTYAKYKDKLSKGNNFSEELFGVNYQLVMNQDGYFEEEKPIESYYAVITYGGKKKLEFVNLLIPQNGFKEIAYQLDVKKALLEPKINLNNPQIKRRRAQIREYIINEIKRESGMTT